MFALRSSPSSLVCDLRNSLLPAEGAGFQLSAPRPRRASVRLGFDIYYAGGGANGSGESNGGDCGLGGSGGGGAFSPAVSDYAGVFEAGDPARARESMNNNNFGAEHQQQRAAPRAGDDFSDGRYDHRFSQAPAAGVEEEQERGGAVGGVAFSGDEDDGSSLAEEDDCGGLLEEDFLFEMEGLKEEEQLERQHDGSGMRVAGNGRSGTSEGWAAAAATSAAAAVAVASSSRGTGSRVEGGGSGSSPRNFYGTPTYASPGAGAAGGERKRVGGVVAAGGGGTALRKPRVIAPRGTRCIGGGMYRLRLSTSC